MTLNNFLHQVIAADSATVTIIVRKVKVFYRYEMLGHD